MSHFFARLAQNTLTAHPMPKAQLSPAATFRSTNAAWDNVELPLVNSLDSIQDEKKEINPPASEPQVDLIQQPLTLAKEVSKPQIAREQGSFPLDIANNAVVPVKEKPVSSVKDGKMPVVTSRPDDLDASFQASITNLFRTDAKKEDNVILHSAGLVQSVIDPVASHVQTKKEIPLKEPESSPHLIENKKREFDITLNPVISAKEWPVSVTRDDKKDLTHFDLSDSSSFNKESFLKPLPPSVIKVSSDENIDRANTKDTATLTDSIPLNAASIAPNVHVHIGRLEIRAAKPKAPLAVNRSQRQSKPRAKPALSLREYLKKYPGESV
jgi:hypothetical protein